MCSLKVRFTQSPERRDVFEYALRVEVVSAKGISKKIFVYHQLPADIDGNTSAEFDHIATPVDFQEIPEDAASETVPWYRTDKCTVWLRCAADLKTAKQLFVDDIKALQSSYSVLTSENDFVDQTTVEFAGEAEAPSVKPVVPEGDVEEEIEKIREDVAGKIGNDAMSGVQIRANTADGMRKAIEAIGSLLGADVVKTKGK